MCLTKPSSKERAKINVCSVAKDGALGRCLPSTKSPKFIFILIVENISFLHIYASLLGPNRLLVNCFFFLKKSCDCSQWIDPFSLVPKALPLFWCPLSNGTVAALLKYLQLCDFCGFWCHFLVGRSFYCDILDSLSYFWCRKCLSFISFVLAWMTLWQIVIVQDSFWMLQESPCFLYSRSYMSRSYVSWMQLSSGAESEHLSPTLLPELQLSISSDDKAMESASHCNRRSWYWTYPLAGRVLNLSLLPQGVFWSSQVCLVCPLYMLRSVHQTKTLLCSMNAMSVPVLPSGTWDLQPHLWLNENTVFTTQSIN